LKFGTIGVGGNYCLVAKSNDLDEPSELWCRYERDWPIVLVKNSSIDRVIGLPVTIDFGYDHFVQSQSASLVQADSPHSSECFDRIEPADKDIVMSLAFDSERKRRGCEGR
jgi:hypothetical protein